MNRYSLTLAAILFVGMGVFFLQKYHGVAAIRSHLPGVMAANKRPVPMMAIQSCGCVADTDEPTTPLSIKQAKEKQQREERQEKIRNKQIALRLRRMVSVGMSRQQVEKIMGEPEWMGTPEVTVKGHPSEDADFFGDYQVAYTANDKVTSVSPF